jgi:hypothetical protein
MKIKLRIKPFDTYWANGGNPYSMLFANSHKIYSHSWAGNHAWSDYVSNNSYPYFAGISNA